jgi:hypothetical protein
MQDKGRFEMLLQVSNQWLYFGRIAEQTGTQIAAAYGTLLEAKYAIRCK